MIIHRPKIRFDPGPDTSPIEATIAYDGRIRIQTDPDAMRLVSTFMTPAEAREFALELTGLADAAEAINDEWTEVS